jgi:hypothetical protein
MVFNSICNNISVISWLSVLLVEETGVPGENHWPAVCHWQTLSHNIVSSIPRLRGVRLKNIFLAMYTLKSAILSPCCISKINPLSMQHQHVCFHVTEIVFVIFTSIFPSGRSGNNCLFIVPMRSCNILNCPLDCYRYGNKCKCVTFYTCIHAYEQTNFIKLLNVTSILGLRCHLGTPRYKI